MPKLTKKQKEAATARRERIRALYWDHGLTQVQVAKKVKVTQQYVSRVIRDGIFEEPTCN